MRTKIHWLSVGLAYSSLFLFGLNDNLRGPLFPEVLRDLHLTDTQGSLLWATASFFGIFASLINNRLVKRMGLMASLRCSMLLMGLGHLGMALSHNFAFALLSSLVFGLSLGFLGVLQNVLVLQAGPEDSTSRLQGGLHSNYALASLLAPLLLTALHFVFPEWRAGYLAGALLTFAGALVFFMIPTRKLEEHHEFFSTQEVSSQRSHGKSLYLGVILGLYVLAEVMVSSRLALYLQRSGYDFTQASLATSGFFLGLLFFRVALIFWQPAKGVKKPLLLSFAASFIFLTLGLMHWPVLLVISGLTMAPIFPLLMSYVREKFPSDLAFVTAYVVAVDGMFVVLMHVFVGVSSDSWGIQKALIIGPVACLVAFLLLVFDFKIYDRHVKIS